MAESADHSDLVVRLRAGDPAALEDAYKLHAARCNAIAYRVLGDDDAARDAVQEAFLSLWRHRHGLVVRTSGVYPWLAVVTRNAAIGQLRSMSARTRREERAYASGDPASAPDPADLVVSSGSAVELRSALAALPEEQKTVIVQAYFQFRTMAQIAEGTETPLGTVKRRAQLALRNLSRILSEQRS